jgi:tyrosyl-tRNA synthetase
MGKTAEGAVWLDTDRTSPYEYYQFWINTDDRDVARFMALFTFLPMDEVRRLERIEGADLNSAKTVLAFETTRLAHGEDEAIKACLESARLFGSRRVPEEIVPSSAVHSMPPRGETVELKAGEAAVSSSKGDLTVIPQSFLDESQLKKGVPAFKLFHTVGLAASGGAARRLIKDGGGYVNGERIEAFDTMITDKHLNKGEILLRAGKKRYHRIRAKEDFSGDL